MKYNTGKIEREMNAGGMEFEKGSVYDRPAWREWETLRIGSRVDDYRIGKVGWRRHVDEDCGLG